jgi:hypothetical protein
MNPIRPQDLVRLRHTPEFSGEVVVLVDELALVDFGNAGLDVLSWVPLEFVELAPGQSERLAA